MNKGDRPHYMRGQWKAGVFAPLGMQESHALTGLSRANALALVPAAGTIGMGEAVELLPL